MADDAPPGPGFPGLVLCCASAVLAGVVEVLLVPLYRGATIFPVTVLLAVATNAALPTLARRLSSLSAAAVAPVVAWLATVLILALTPRSEGDVLVPGSGAAGVVAMVMLLAGALTGVGTVLLGGLRRPIPGRGASA